MMDVFLFGFDIEKVVGNIWYFILIMMVFDILTGVLRAGKERKINSTINLDGLLKKLGILIGLAFVSLLDVYFKQEGLMVKIAVGAIIAYEGYSIIENLDSLGVNWLQFVSKYFEKGEKHE